MEISEIVVTILIIIMLIPTLASLTRFDIWWVRGFDFPRIQISFLTVVMFIAGIYFLSFNNYYHYILLLLLILSFIYQAVLIFPYTPLAKKRVLSFEGTNPKAEISILVSNVLTPNKRSDKLITEVYKHHPDILLTLESDQRWENELSVIEKDYPYTIKIPQDNLYGMHLYSKLKLEDIEVKYLVSDEIPSIHGYVRMRNNVKIKIHCLHPKPPSPSEDITSTNRDAELLLVGRNVKKDKEPVLLLGDLNDVAWSRTTSLFKRISGLLDPRLGRGFYNTFHAKFPIFRWPLDHVFHTRDFTLVKLARLKSIGSDHFPMFIRLNYEPKAENLQEEPEKPNKEMNKWAKEKIDVAEPREREI